MISSLRQHATLTNRARDERIDSDSIADEVFIGGSRFTGEPSVDDISRQGGKGGFDS